jgi:septin 7
MKLYEFPECDDDDENKLTKIYKDKVPFAVVGSNFILEKGTKRTRVRQYAWGTVDGKIFLSHLSNQNFFKFSRR